MDQRKNKLIFKCQIYQLYFCLFCKKSLGLFVFKVLGFSEQRVLDHWVIVFTALKLKSGLENKFLGPLGKNASMKSSFLSTWNYLSESVVYTYRSSGVLEQVMDVTAILLKPEFQESEKGENHVDNIEDIQICFV